ncbi:hypothetical protein KKH23_08270 [Patescibacteria group bacterium]|nr:hypothetical protein [Patescibacteria group bacterium]
MDQYIIILTGIKEEYDRTTAIHSINTAVGENLPSTEGLDSDLISESLDRLEDGAEFIQRGFDHTQVSRYCELMDEAGIAFEIYNRIF